MSPWFVALCGALLLTALPGSAYGRSPPKDSGKCPPTGFDAVKLDLKKYAAAPWYVQMQQPLLYQPSFALYCVRARYSPLDSKDISAGLEVHNYANMFKVNGIPLGAGLIGGLMKVFAKPEYPNDSKQTGKLLVGPASPIPFVPNGGVSKYWVVATGPSKNCTLGYDWAIVSAGAPGRSSSKGGCLTGASTGAYDSGLWFFSRKQVDPDNTAIMMKKAQDLGYDTSVLKSVKQDGCKYRGAV